MAATATATTTLLASAVAGAIKEASTRTRLHQWALAMLVLATLLGTGLHQPNPSKFNMRRRPRLICSQVLAQGLQVLVLFKQGKMQETGYLKMQMLQLCKLTMNQVLLLQRKGVERINPFAFVA